MDQELKLLYEKKDVLVVSTNSRPKAVAGAIAGLMRELGYLEIRAVGGGAVNQAVKAVAIARQFLFNDKIDIVLVPDFVQIEIEGKKKTGIHMEIYRRSNEQHKTIA